MIDTILGNKTNILILRFLNRFDNQFFSAEEITQETGAGLRNVYDSLKLLTQILKIKVVKGKTYYQFIIDSEFKTKINQLFETEKKRVFLRTLTNHKILAELESRIIKITGSNIMDIFLFGGIAKGRDTAQSDIDLCVLLKKSDSKIVRKIKSIPFDDKYSREIQIHVFTLENFMISQRAKNPLILNILKDGISLMIK